MIRTLRASLLLRLIVLVACTTCFSYSFAEDEAPPEEGAEEAVAEGEEGAPSTPQAIYLPIKPQFVVNYGAAGRLRYLKAELSVRLASSDAAYAIREHLPWVRNNLVMMFASQTNETVSSQEGKEKMLADARTIIQDIIERENGLPPDSVVDVYFNTFFVQK